MPQLHLHPSTQQETHTTILGAGIIGVSTAYYLSLSHSPSHSHSHSQSQPSTSQPPNPKTRKHTIHLIDPTPSLFASASGHAGGFLASDWFSPAVAALGALSFHLHKELADEFGGRERWGWCRSGGVSVTSGASTKGESGLDWLNRGSSRANARERAGHEYWGSGDGEGVEEGPAWLARRTGERVEGLGGTHVVYATSSSTALERGVQLHQPAHALSILRNEHGEMSGLRVALDNSREEILLPCTHLLIASGAWTPRVFSALLPNSRTKIPITSLAGHSLVVRTPRWATEHEEKGCHAVFATDDDGFSPEIFSRVGGEVYLAGLNNASLKLPDPSKGEAKVDEKEVARLRKTAARMLGGETGNDLEVVRAGLCFRPVTSWGEPVVSRVEDAKLGDVKTRNGGEGGVFVAAGHGPWGISQSLGTGKVMSEMLQGLPTSADISGLSL